MLKRLISAFLVLAMLLCVIPFSQSITASAQAEGTGYYKVNVSSSLNMRSGAGTSYSKVASLPNGAVVNVTTVQGIWGKTTYNGSTGWISLDYASKTSAPVVSKGNVNVIGAFAELRVKFPNGKYWNHVGSSSKNLDGWTNTPCSSSGSAHKSTAYCNGQCAGFANKLGLDIFGTATSKWTSKSSVKDLCIGDIVRYNSKHSIMVTKIVGDDLYIVDCNWECNCNIRWDAFFDTSKYFKTINYVYHNPDNTFKSTDSTLYTKPEAGSIGKVTITANNQKLYASADSSSALVGIALKDDAFYCYDEKKSDGATWYKVKLNTVYGWVSSSGAKLKKDASASTTTTAAPTTTARPTTTTRPSETTTTAKTTTTTAAAAKKITVTGSTVNVRKDAGTSYAKVTSVKKGSTYTYTDTKTVSGVVWYKIKVSSSKTGWISGQYAKVVTTATTTKATTKATTAAAKKVTVTGSTVNVRKGAGTSYAKVTSVKKGSTYTYTETKTVSGVVWYKIKVSSSKTGWISGQYVKKA